MINAWVARHRDMEQHLSTWDGRVGVGSADFDHLLKATVGEAYLRVLRKGGSPQEARDEAVKDGNHCVKVWNERTSKTRAYMNGPHELKRWEKAGEAAADDLHIWFLNMTRR